METQMNLATRMAVILTLAVPGLAGAQSSPPANVGDNANILPIYQSSDPPAADDYLRGNLLGQRCNEASIGISTLNPDHMMVFCNDYRATFNFDDSLVPSGKTTLVAAVWNEVKTFWAWLTGQPAPEPEARKIIASAEAGIGGGVSYDGGTTWQGFMVPGGPNDDTPASLAHPGKQLGLQGYSDPFAINMKDGRVGVVYIGFTRDKVSGESTQSGVYFTRYRDRNASDVLHDWEYEFSAQVALSNNLKQGQFLDKVSAAVGPDGRLYVAFTRFTGKSGSANIFLAQSGDGGWTWDAASIDKDAKYGQAALPLVDPTDASAVGVLWRTFVDNSLLFKSTRKGTKNVDLFAGDIAGPYLPFDQYSQAVDAADPDRVAFRTLAFPAADYTPDGGRLVAVFTEWTDLGTGEPGTAGYPMPLTVMKVSTDQGATWSGRYVLNVLNGEWDQVPASPERLGFFSPARPVGAQFQPAVSCTVGHQCLVVWKQSYDAILAPGGPENLGSLVAAGLTRRFDVRGALVTFDGAGPSVSPSFQVSRYGYRELEPGELPSQVTDDQEEWLAHMELPNGTRYKIVDYGNRNHSGGGQVAFAGDYIGVEAIESADGDAEFMVAFSDNRYNIWPWQTEFGGLVPPGQEWAYYPVFMAPNDPESAVPGVSCVNYGSRVQSVMAARVSTSGLLLNAPTNSKPFEGALPVCGGTDPGSECIEFPLSVRNNTGVERTVSLSVSSGWASFAKRPFDETLDVGELYDYPLVTGEVTIYPYSSYALNIYAFDDNPVTVTATAGTDVATVTFNDPAVRAASAENPAFTYVPSTVNIESGSARSGSARSGSARSGSARSGSARSGSARSYPVPEDPVPGETVYDVIDYTYVVTPGSQDDAGTYLSLFNIDPAYEGSYVFQVFVTKPLTSFMTDEDDTCAAFDWTEGALVGHISDPENPLVSGSARSGSARSGSARSGSARSGSARSAIPSDGDPLVQNTSFTLGSSTETVLGGTLEASAPMASASTSSTGAAQNCLIDDCTLAAPRLPNEVTLLVRAYQIRPDGEIPVKYDPDGSRTGTPTPPSVAVAEYSCDDPSCTAALGPDLVVQTDPAPDPPIVPDTRVKAGTAVPFPTVTLSNDGVDGECGTPDEPRPCGDARPHQWAVYASTEADFDLVPRWDCSVDDCATGQISGTVKENADPTDGAVVTVLLATGDHGELGVGGVETAVVGDLAIPATLPRTDPNGTGTYYLHFYDDRGRIVNELDETNNHWTEGPIIVESPGYGFLGLQTPCDGQTCDKTGAVVLAWQFTDGQAPVDSGETLPRLAFYDGCPAPTDADGIPTGALLASSAPDPTDTTTGSSGWQYFPDPGMTRPQYTWQFNFDATGLVRGVCYSMYVEIPDTGQVIGSTEEGLEPFGPFYITPR
jgi:hypothetical protein